MSLLLAPYNDSMRLGQGFNSYTQTLCLDKAVEVSNVVTIKTKVPSQVVAYSSRFVEKLSEVVDTMNISYSSSIKKGTIELAGNTSAVDESTFKQSDLNVVVSVKVVNQTTILQDTSKFKDLEGVKPGTEEFNDIYGDSFISGFIEGGDFLGVVSIKVLDRSKVGEVARELKKGMNTMKSEGEFTLSDIPESGSFGSASASRETEASISVNWMGGGEIKRPEQNWDLDTLYEAAAAFPSKVAECPQRTWAVLTKYKQNSSYVDWARKQNVVRSPLDYDNVISYTGELFDSYMEYKVLLRKLREIIKNRHKYIASGNVNAIPLDVRSLVAVRSALHDEMSKIVKAVDTLSKDPASLSRHAHIKQRAKPHFIQKILNYAINDTSGEPKNTVDLPDYWNPQEKVLTPPSARHKGSEDKKEWGGGTKRAEEGEGEDTEKKTEDKSPSSSRGDPVSSNTVTTTHASQREGAPTATPEYYYNFSELVAPEIWEEVMPVLRPQEVEESDGSSPTAVVDYPPPPPDDDILAPLEVVIQKPPKGGAEDIPESAAGDRALLWGTAIAAYGIKEEKGFFCQDETGSLLHTICQGELANWGTSVVGCPQRPKIGTPLATIAVNPKDKRLFYVTTENKLRMLVSSGRSWYDANVNFDDIANQDTKLVAWASSEGITVAYANETSELSFWFIRNDVGAIIRPTLTIDFQVTQCPGVMPGASLATFLYKNERHLLYQSKTSFTLIKVARDMTATIVENARFLNKLPLAFDARKPMVFAATNWKDPVGKWSENLPSRGFNGILLLAHDHISNLKRIYIDDAIPLQNDSGVIELSGIVRQEYSSTALSVTFDHWVGNSFYQQNAKGQVIREFTQWKDNNGKMDLSSSGLGIIVGSEQKLKGKTYASGAKILVIAKPECNIAANSDPTAVRAKIGDQWHQVVFFVGIDFQLYYTYNKYDTRKWFPGGERFYNLGPVKLSTFHFLANYNESSGNIDILATGQGGTLFHLRLGGGFENWANATWIEIEGSWNTAPSAWFPESGEIHAAITGTDCNLYCLEFDGKGWARPTLQEKLPGKLKCAPCVVKNKGVWVTCVGGDVYRSTGWDSEKQVYSGFEREKVSIDHKISPVVYDVGPDKRGAILVNDGGRAMAFNLLKGNDQYKPLGELDMESAQILSCTEDRLEVLWLRTIGKFEYVVWGENFSYFRTGKWLGEPYPAGRRVSIISYPEEGSHELYFFGSNGKIMKQWVHNWELDGPSFAIGGS
ncbi:hypothetical protein TWF481_003722 [Arthrobotrys musiformis]|uniref:Fucose-specific lectin n=1 Tax=Arthrobotrys musiformis TaxID=47236 RepID=A0AAV9WHC7_9PEZI